MKTVQNLRVKNKGDG